MEKERKFPLSPQEKDSHCSFDNFIFDILINARMWFIITDKKYTPVYISQECIDNCGYSNEEFLSDKDLFQNLFSNKEKNFFHMSVNKPTEYTIRKKNNEEECLLFTKKESEYQGEPFYFYWATGKTSNLLSANTIPNKFKFLKEEQFNWLMEFVPDIVTLLDENGQIIYNSPSFNRLHGYNANDFIGNQPSDYVHPDDLELFNENVYRVMTNPGTIVTERYRYRDKSNQYLWMETIAVRYESITIAVSRDISERVKMEEKIKRSNEKLKILNDTKNRLFSVIVHDLKTPFNSLINLSELIIDNDAPISLEERNVIDKNIYDTSCKTYHLLENLLQWFRMQSNDIHFNPDNIDLYKIVKSCFSFFRIQSTYKELSFVVDSVPGIEVFADWNMVDTIVRNLLSNAMKFSAKKGTITVHIVKEEDEVIVSVEDQGTGMSKKVSEGLFKTATKIPGSGTMQEKGSGIGLLLCNEFVEQNHGRIWVESKPGKGSTFYFTLPAAK